MSNLLAKVFEQGIQGHRLLFDAPRWAVLSG